MLFYYTNEHHSHICRRWAAAGPRHMGRWVWGVRSLGIGHPGTPQSTGYPTGSCHLARYRALFLVGSSRSTSQACSPGLCSRTLRCNSNGVMISPCIVMIVQRILLHWSQYMLRTWCFCGPQPAWLSESMDRISYCTALTALLSVLATHRLKVTFHLLINDGYTLYYKMFLWQEAAFRQRKQVSQTFRRILCSLSEVSCQIPYNFYT